MKSARFTRWTRTLAAALLAIVLTGAGTLPAALADDTATGSAVQSAAAEPSAEPEPKQVEPKQAEPEPEPEPAPDPEPAPKPKTEPSPEPSAEPTEEPSAAPTGKPAKPEPAETEPSSAPEQPTPSVPVPDQTVPEEIGWDEIVPLATDEAELQPLAASFADFPQPTLPVGQSDQPAPASRAKRVIQNVHTDAVSAYLDNGTLVAQTKADLDVDGDGKVDLGTRLVTRELLFHVADAAKVAIPNVPGFDFLGTPGEIIWLAPMVQNPAIIWPGFSTEDPNLRGKATSLDFRLVGVDGPGRVEVFLGTTGRAFSSTTDLPAWRSGVPQHTHMDWAFSRAGTYTLTFEISGQVDGRQQTARNDYTFVVGDLAAHTKPTSVAFQAGKTGLEQGEPVQFTAQVSPADAVGAVQFRDTSSGRVLGHTPVTNGVAEFVATALNPGVHRLVAEFVPTWSSDFKASASAGVEVTVAGEVQERPSHKDTTPVPGSVLKKHTAGSVVEVTSTGKKAVIGSSLAVRVKSAERAGRWLSVWLPGQKPAWRGWVQADQSGAFSVDLAGARARSQQLVVKDADGGFVGWDRFELTEPPKPGGDGGNNDGDKPDDGKKDDGEKPKAPDSKTCRPGITLDRGHIDAFYVSAANGQAVLQLMEDVTGYHVIREAETVLLRVKESAYGSVRGAPKGTPAKGYVLPLTQRSDLIWPGWDTNRTTTSGYTDVSIKVTRVKGPGTVSLYTQGDWGSWASLLNGGRYKLPGTIREKRPVHTHAQWVFSKKGIYRLTVHAVATNPDTGKSIKTAAHTYVFQVGDVPLGDTFCGLKSRGAKTAKQVNAAVNQATKQALEEARAAEQADTETAQPTDGPTLGPSSGPLPGQRPSGQPEQVGPVPVDTGDGGAAGGNQALVAGLFGLGSGLAIAGITAGTMWYVRRLRRGMVADAPA